MLAARDRPNERCCHSTKLPLIGVEVKFSPTPIKGFGISATQVIFVLLFANGPENSSFQKTLFVFPDCIHPYLSVYALGAFGHFVHQLISPTTFLAHENLQNLCLPPSPLPPHLAYWARRHLRHPVYTKRPPPQGSLRIRAAT